MKSKSMRVMTSVDEKTDVFCQCYIFYEILNLQKNIFCYKIKAVASFRKC